MIDALQWFGATFAVLALVLLMAHGLRRFMERSRPTDGSIRQVGSWRVAPDANVRAVRVLDQVHVLYERGRETVVLDTMGVERIAEFDAIAGSEGPLSLLRARRRSEAPASRVARA